MLTSAVTAASTFNISISVTSFAPPVKPPKPKGLNMYQVITKVDGTRWLARRHTGTILWRVYPGEFRLLPEKNHAHG